MEWKKATCKSVLVLLLVAAGGSAQSKDGGIYVDGPSNALTASEAASGYRLLWNGKDFSGWKSYQASSPGGNFAIVGMAGQENGARKSQNPDSNVIEVVGSGESMWTADTSYQDFDWMVEFQTGPDNPQNGGLLYRYSERAGRNNNASAFEYQICNSRFAQWNQPDVTAGAVYLLKPLMPSRLNGDKTPNWMRAAGHWNQARIICYKGRIAHYGNGLRLAEDKMGTPDWTSRYEKSKFGEYPYFATIHPGSFFLQAHVNDYYVKYRNLRVKKLTEDPWGRNSPYLNKADAAAGDTSLIDTLTFASPLFTATGTGSAPAFAIAPKPVFVRRPDGLAILVGDAQGYEVRLHDARGAMHPAGARRSAEGLFVPAESVPAGGILSLWKGGQRVREPVRGIR